MAWYDRLSTWVDHLLERTFGLHDFFERQFHAFGMHGPYTRHLVKTRIGPAVLLGLTMLMALAAVLLIRRWRARRRRAIAAVPARFSAVGGRPPSR
jgi:hypothetical protein